MDTLALAALVALGCALWALLGLVAWALGWAKVGTPLLLVLLAVLATGLLGQGCTPLHERRAELGTTHAALQVPQADWRPSATDAQCASWDNARLTWGVVGTVSGALGAAGGGVTLLGDLVGDDKAARLALGLTSVLLGALTVGAEYAQDGLAARYTAECTVPVAVPESS